MNTERWSYVPGFPRYQCSTEGRFKRDGANRFMQGKRDRLGYVMIGLVRERCDKQRWLLAHRIVAATFLDLPLETSDKFQTVNHKNRKRDDNRLANLEVITMAQNNEHWRKTSLQSIKAGLA